METCLSGLYHEPRMQVILVGWDPPLENWIKFNIDGCSKGNPGSAAGGGVFRDYRGRCVVGFMCNIGYCSAIGAELWAAFHGLTIAWNKGLRKLVLAMDSTLALYWLSKRSICNSHLSNLVHSCSAILSYELDAKLVHVHREKGTELLIA
ncbi:conserved hypothetical protein [Ricinus communis]|uniref:RNase H type-1 domain-containing protein n=1 Tax=Ricinus communis TaxID=3988 RepID=B9S5J7_RICCO|nr:conserved hypothetical protein [Ricinus communis]